MWEDLRSLVRIERVNAPEAPLLAPDQAFFLRENLKLRLLGARLALLARDQLSYKADLSAAIEWSSRYFDAAAPVVASSIDTLNSMAQSDIRIELTDLAIMHNPSQSVTLTVSTSAHPAGRLASDSTLPAAQAIQFALCRSRSCDRPGRNAAHWRGLIFSGD
jgi:uroporphyrin-3 C-methyltransferase